MGLGALGWSATGGATELSGLGHLRAQVSGPVLVRGDDLYEPSRRVASHNTSTDKYPSAIVGPMSAQDVAAAVRFARECELPIAIQSGGHDVLGEDTVEGGVLIHMGLMARAEVRNDTVSVQPGIRAGQLNAQLGQDGLVVPLGCHPNVGVGGLTLGGGLGWLLGSHGVTCDALTSAGIVLADGRIVVASEQPT